MQNVIRHIQRFFDQVIRVIQWIPVIWKTHDWDSAYAIDVFAYQLERTAKRLESVTHYNGKPEARRIRMILRLMKKVCDEDYSMEWMDIEDRVFGKSKLVFHPAPEFGDGMMEIHREYDRKYTAKEREMIDESMRELRLRCYAKQERAHKLLWDLIEHNIQRWWD